MGTEKHQSGIELRPNALDWALARKVHCEYAQKSGAQYIATQFALAHFSTLVRVIKPSDVLEFDAGIGTISRLLLDHCNEIIIEELKRRHLTIQFVKYNQGVRYFNWSTQHPDGRDRLLPKFNFRKNLKGCWVGQVSDLATS